MKVYIVGMGPGHPDFLTIQGKRAVEESRVILGDRRMTEAFSSLGKNIISTYKPSEIRRVLASMEDGDGPAMRKGPWPSSCPATSAFLV